MRTLTTWSSSSLDELFGAGGRHKLVSVDALAKG